MGLWMAVLLGGALPVEARQAGLAEAVASFEAGRYGAVIAQLEAVVAAAPAHREAPWGAAAYWLGEAYAALGRRSEALAVWEAGLRALDEQGAFAPRMAEVYVHTVFALRNRPRYAWATQVYLALLSRLDGPGPSVPAVVKARVLDPLRLILPEAVKATVGLGADPAAALPAGTGARLVRWWRRADPFPATPANERLEEHLERVAYARLHYPSRTHPRGYDARGAVYVRLGAPRHATTLTFDEIGFTHFRFDQGVATRTVTTSITGFPDNAFWVYDQVDEAAQYLFVKAPGGDYTLAEPLALLPATLRSGVSTVNGRRRDKARLLLQVLERLYAQLAHLHQAYGPRHGAIADYLGRLEDLEMSPNERILTPAFIAQPVPVFAQAILEESRVEDRVAARRRDAAVPPAFTNVFDAVERLTPAIRWARFLDEDGTTRTEVYWSLPAEALVPTAGHRRRLVAQGHPPSSTYLLTLTAVRQGAGYRALARHVTHHLASVPPRASGWTLPPRTLVVAGDTGRYHLALQWDAHWVAIEGEAVRPGPQVKVGSFRIDTLRALRADPRRLEMSDLKPLLVADTSQHLEAAAPYPYTRLTAGARVALSFEVYHLAFGADERTHYTVSYRVRRRGDPEGEAGADAARQETRTRAPYTGQTRRASEYVLLDLGGWQDDGALDVTVRVVDQTTGQAVERTVGFVLVAPPERDGSISER